MWERDLCGSEMGTFQTWAPPPKDSTAPALTAPPLRFSGQEEAHETLLKGPLLPLLTTTYLATGIEPPSAPCPSVSRAPDAEFHSLFNLSWKCLVIDPASATWHPLSRCGSAMLTKKVIFQPSWKWQELELTC